MIRFACPRCRSVLKAPAEKAGSKVACPKCRQRLQIPIPPRNKTMLATLLTPPRQQRSREIDADDSDVEPHRGVMVMLFGVLSLFTIPFVFGPMAWIMGSRDLRQMRAGQMDNSGWSMTQAGRICGMITTLVCMVLPLVAVFSCCVGNVFLFTGSEPPEPVQTQPRPTPVMPGTSPPQPQQR